MNMILVKSLYTLVLFVAFIALCFWAYSPKRKQSFHDAKMLPFTDEIVPSNKQGESAND